MYKCDSMLVYISLQINFCLHPVPLWCNCTHVNKTHGRHNSSNDNSGQIIITIIFLCSPRKKEKRKDRSHQRNPSSRYYLKVLHHWTEGRYHHQFISISFLSGIQPDVVPATGKQKHTSGSKVQEIISKQFQGFCNFFLFTGLY